MSTRHQSLFRIGLALAAACAASSWLISVTASWPLKTHATILGALSLTFAICESFFRSLLGELNSAIRSPSLSVTQKERMFAIAQPAKARLLSNSIFLIILKILSALCAALLGTGLVGPRWVQSVLMIGYSSILISLPLMFTIYYNWRRVDRFLDDLSLEDTRNKERRKLKEDLAGGNQIDLTNDPQLKGYTTVAPFREH